MGLMLDCGRPKTEAVSWISNSRNPIRADPA